MKNVGDHVTIIRDDPLADREAIHGHRLDPMILLQTVVQFAGDGFQVRFGRAGADDEKIREAGNPAEVDGEDILGFFFRGEMGAQSGERFRIDGTFFPGKGDGQ